mgnify:CR=1 FL=1
MPVFDFSGASDKKPGVQSECTYTTFQSNEKETSPEKPIMILDNSSRQWKHHLRIYLIQSNVHPLNLKRMTAFSVQISSVLIQDL